MDLERQMEAFKQDLKDMGKQVNELEKVSGAREQQIKGFFREMNTISKSITRLEKTILDELKSSQTILKGMIDNDWAIDKAKLDLEQEIERKKQELEGQQRSHEIEMKKQKAAMKKELYFKIGGIMLPVLTALATGISYFIQKLFE